MKSLSQFKPTAEQIGVAESVYMAMAFADTIRPIVEGYQKDILQKHQFHVAPHWVEIGAEKDRAIFDPKDAYQLTDEDFAVFLAECNEARIAAKLHVESDDYCPLLVAEELQKKAEHFLIEVMEPVTGINLDKLLCSADGLGNLAKYLELTLRLMAPFVKPTLKTA